MLAGSKNPLSLDMGSVKGCHQQNKLYSFETKKIDDQVILILKNTSNKPIDLSLKVQTIKCLPVNKETAFIFKKEEFKDTYYDEIEAKESTQYQEYNNFDIDRITDISLQQLNECIKKTKNDKKKGALNNRVLYRNSL